MKNKMNAKKKGNAGENKFANWLRDNGIKAWKDPASGGGSREKGDVGNNLNLHMEVKTVKKINLKEVWQKAEFECQKTHNSPLIAIHFDGMRENEWLIVLHSEDWLDLIKGEADKAPEFTDQTIKWDIQRLVEAGKKVIKRLE